MSSDGQTPPGVAIGKAEIGLGVLVFVYATLSPMIGQFLPALEPDALYGLWPVMLLLLGPTLVLGGASLLKQWRWPLIAHLPLLGWIVITFMAFFQAS
jgi:hypothetical protein